MVTQTAGHITEHEFLRPEEVALLLQAIDEHKQIAVDRNPQQPGTFVTYGRAAYLDVCQAQSDPERDYALVVAESNRHLQVMFGDLYERLRARVEELLGEPVAYEPETLALPGLHLFRGAGIRAASRGGVHFDVQYQKLRFPAPMDRGSEPISVTLPLRNPAHGTGLQVYNVTFPDYERAYRMGRINSLEELVERKTSAYHPYRPGFLQLHHRLVVHSLTSPGPIEPDDVRITLQGHGLRCDGRWILYW